MARSPDPIFFSRFRHRRCPDFGRGAASSAQRRPMRHRSGNTQPTIVFVLVAGILLGCVGLAIFHVMNGDSKQGVATIGSGGPGTGPASPIGEAGTGEAQFSLESLVDELISSGWDAAAARAVVELNAGCLAAVNDEIPEELGQILALWRRLGTIRHAQPALVRRPELAGLLAGSLEIAADGPERILKAFELFNGEDDVAVLTSLYMLSAAPEDGVALARTLDRDGDLILRLCRRHAWDAIVWFDDLPPDRAGRDDYRRWLRDIFESALNSADDEALDRAQALLVIHSGRIRKKFASDPEFRREFLPRYWPMFERVLSAQSDELSWAVYVGDPRVWDLLIGYPEEGEHVFRRHGALAVDLLVGDDYRECRQQVFDALQQGENEAVIAALYDDELRQQPLFRKLMQRALPGDTLAAALYKLTADSADAPRLLRYYDQLSDTALIEEIGGAPEGGQTWIPGYAIYYLGKKYAQGREIEGMDVVLAAVDAAEVVFVAKGASRGLKLVQQGLKDSAKKRGLTKVAKAVETASARQLHPAALREGHKAVRKGLRESLRDKASLDVTDIVRFAFRKSGIGRESFKRLTALEARVFMPADRRVVIDLAAMVGKDHVLGRFLAVSAVNAGVDIVLQTDTGQGAVHTAAEKLQAWKQHVSVWWLAHATGTFESAD
jgi:hypothetical protein